MAKSELITGGALTVDIGAHVNDAQKAAMFVVILTSFLLFSNLASACDPHATCLDIQWCINNHDDGGAIKKAAQNGDGNGIGVDTAACQHKYGQPGPTGSWDSVSAGCSNNDYAAIGKKALGGNSGSCD